MSELTSTKPYLIRALHEWCTDNGLTPHLLVAVNAQTRVPMGYVKNGEIVLNLNYAATRDLLIGSEAITFSARFGGVSQNLYVPMGAVRAVFARENNQGMFFDIETETGLQPEQATGESAPEASAEKPKKPSLKLVK